LPAVARLAGSPQSVREVVDERDDRVDEEPGGELPQQTLAALLKERIYGDFACLSSLLVLTGHVDDGADGWSALLDVGVVLIGLFGASLVAEFLGHTGALGHPPHGRELWQMTRASGQILEAGVPAAILMILAGLDVIPFDIALWIAIWVLTATLGLFALLAARRTSLSWWGKTLLVLALLGVGVLVVGLKYLAH
jgi:hypothetical protein